MPNRVRTIEQKDMIAIENVQRRASKLVSNIKHLSYQERFKENWRKGADLIEVYKIINNIDQVEKDKFFTFPTYAATTGPFQK